MKSTIVIFMAQKSCGSRNVNSNDRLHQPCIFIFTFLSHTTFGRPTTTLYLNVSSKHIMKVFELHVVDQQWVAGHHILSQHVNVRTVGLCNFPCHRHVVGALNILKKSGAYYHIMKCHETHAVAVLRVQCYTHTSGVHRPPFSGPGPARVDNFFHFSGPGPARLV